MTEEETQHFLDMCDDRNLTVHTYSESLAESIGENLVGYATLLRQWLDRIVQKISAVSETSSD